MNVYPIHTSLFQRKDDLYTFIIQHVPSISDGDILVITSKIVSLSENTLIPMKKKVQVLTRQSDTVIETPWALLTLINGEWTINGGIDESNAKTDLIPLPSNPHKTANTLMRSLKKVFKLRKFGVIITDTRSIPLRVGTMGRAIGFAGFEPLKSYVGKNDLFGRKSRLTISNHADALAGAAVLTMGEGSEQSPLALIQHAPVVFTNRTMRKKDTLLHIDSESDIFSYIFKKNIQKPRE